MLTKRTKRIQLYSQCKSVRDDTFHQIQMHLTPLQNYLLCSIHEGKNTGTLVLPDGVEMQPYAKVKSIGPECKRTAIGDMVLFAPENAVFVDNTPIEKLVIVPEGACFAKYTEEEVGNN